MLWQVRQNRDKTESRTCHRLIPATVSTCIYQLFCVYYYCSTTRNHWRRSSKAQQELPQGEKVNFWATVWAHFSFQRTGKTAYQKKKNNYSFTHSPCLTNNDRYPSESLPPVTLSDTQPAPFFLIWLANLRRHKIKIFTYRSAWLFLRAQVTQVILCGCMQMESTLHNFPTS